MKTNLSVCVALQPLSVNKAWQGRRFKTNNYKRYEITAHYLLPKKEMIKGIVEVSYEFGLEKSAFSRSDVGNLEKCLSDIIVQKGYIEDDRKIAVIHLKKVVSSKWYVKIDIQPYEYQTTKRIKGRSSTL